MYFTKTDFLLQVFHLIIPPKKYLIRLHFSTLQMTFLRRQKMTRNVWDLLKMSKPQILLPLTCCCWRFRHLRTFIFRFYVASARLVDVVVKGNKRPAFCDILNAEQPHSLTALWPDVIIKSSPILPNGRLGSFYLKSDIKKSTNKFGLLIQSSENK